MAESNTKLGTQAGETLNGSTFNISIGQNSGPKTKDVYTKRLWIDIEHTDRPLIGGQFGKPRVVDIWGNLYVHGNINFSGTVVPVLDHHALSHLDYALAGHTGFQATLTAIDGGLGNMAVTIQIRRGLHSALPTLAAGELGFETDTFDVYVGDGATNHRVGANATNVASTIHAAANKTPLVVGDELPIADSEGGFYIKEDNIVSTLDDTAGGTDALVVKAPTSNVMYDHGVATTGVHGAGGNTLLHSGSVIDGGTFV